MDSTGSILLADDEEVFLEATSELLEDEGFTCHQVRNVMEMAEVLSTAEFDLLITDLNMPGNRVLEMVDDVRQQSKALPVIVVTGYPSVPSAVESVRLNVLEYLIKPVPFPNLLEAVKRGVRQKQMLRSVRKAKQEAEERTKRLIQIEETLSVSPDSVQETVIGDVLLADPQVKELRRQIDVLTQLVEPATNRSQGSGTEYFRLREGIFEAIQILQRTKSAFKSKDLAMLRVKLETLLNETAFEDTSGHH